MILVAVEEVMRRLQSQRMVLASSDLHADVNVIATAIVHLKIATSMALRCSDHGLQMLAWFTGAQRFFVVCAYGREMDRRWREQVRGN